MILVRFGRERRRIVMKAIVAVIAGLGLTAAISSPRGAWPWPGEQQPLDRPVCSTSIQQTQSGDEATGSITRRLLVRVPGGRILLGVVSVWVLVGLAVLTIAVGGDANGSSSQSCQTPPAPDGEELEVREDSVIQECRREPVAQTRSPIASRKPSAASVSLFPIGHHRYAHYYGTGRCWRNDPSSAFKPARVQVQEPGGPN